jgi:hypothetical protein
MNVSFSNAATLVKYQKGVIVDESTVDDLESQGCSKIKCYRQKKSWILSSFFASEKVREIPIAEPIYLSFRNEDKHEKAFVEIFSQYQVWLEFSPLRISTRKNLPPFNWIGARGPVSLNNAMPEIDGLICYEQGNLLLDEKIGVFLQNNPDKFHTIKMREIRNDWIWLDERKEIEVLEIQNGCENKIPFIPFHVKELRTQTSYKEISHLLKKSNSVKKLCLKSIELEDLEELKGMESINVQTYYGGPWQLVPKQVTNLLIKGSHVGSGKSKTTLSSLT